MAYIHPGREAARAFFQGLETQLLADEVLTDKQCVQRFLEKAQTEHAQSSRKRFDMAACFRTRLLFPKIDEVLADWCQRREIKADPFKVFRYGGSERGPTQHETAIGPSLAMIERCFDRLKEKVPEIADVRAAVTKESTKAIAPTLRLQHPLPFGAAGDVSFGATRSDLDVGIYRVAMYAATAGDASRGWKYDCGLFVAYCEDRPRHTLGDLWDAWPEVQERVWEAGRVWPIAL